MSVGSLGVYTSDGRVRGSYVYMLLCKEGDAIYVKVGMSNNPTERLRTLVNNCAVPAERMAYVKAWSRQHACRIEKALHHALAKWRVYGEWFRMEAADKPAFNAAWQEVFAAHQRKDWPLKWDQMAVAPYMADAKAKQAYYRRQWKTKGRAYQDFKKHLTSDAR